MFKESSFCASNGCPGVDIRDDTVVMRNNRHPSFELCFDYAEWRAFVAGVKAGEFDLSEVGCHK